MPDDGQAAGRFHAVMPAVAHGIRLSLTVSLSLWVAFALQLSALYWAATSAGLVCLPALGASLRKGQARLVGTLVGSVFVVVLTACFPQDRFAFLFGLAAWCAASAALATLLDNPASYGASLAGYTAIIVAAPLTDPGQVFTQALSRASEISIGIVCATTVLIVTSRPRAGDTLAGALAAIIAETAQQTLATLREGGPDAPDTRPDQRSLVKRTVAARPQADEATGEVSELKRRRATLRHGFEGIFEALSEWRKLILISIAVVAATAAHRQALADLAKAKLDLDRARIVSPVNGWVTNLLWQLGDYASVGEKKVSLVNADSFWVDGYFEETSLKHIHEGDPASIKLMGFDPVLRGHVDSIARGITVNNAQPGSGGLATVNPVFTWVRLAQRLPIRIHIDEVPPGVMLATGLTGTVQIDEPRQASPGQPGDPK